MLMTRTVRTSSPRMALTPSKRETFSPGIKPTTLSMPEKTISFSLVSLSLVSFSLVLFSFVSVSLVLFSLVSSSLVLFSLLSFPLLSFSDSFRESSSSVSVPFPGKLLSAAEDSPFFSSEAESNEVLSAAALLPAAASSAPLLSVMLSPEVLLPEVLTAITAFSTAAVFVPIPPPAFSFALSLFPPASPSCACAGIILFSDVDAKARTVPADITWDRARNEAIRKIKSDR